MEEQFEIKISGITKHPGDKTNNAGTLDDCMNIESVYGEIRPVFPTAHVSSNRGLLFVHIVTNVEYRFYQNDGHLLVYKVVNGEEETNYNFTTALSDVVNGVEAIGNTVIIATTERIIYLLHKNGTYRLLGDKLPFPIITFSLADTPDGNKKYNK